MRYSAKQEPRKRWPRRLVMILAIGLVLAVGATIAVRQVYYSKLQPVSGNEIAKFITVEQGSSVDTIANQLENAGLIRSAWAFKLYVSSKQVRSDLQAGTYSLSPSQTVEQIVAQLTHGKIATDTITILPGQRLDQLVLGPLLLRQRHLDLPTAGRDEVLQVTDARDDPFLAGEDAATLGAAGDGLEVRDRGADGDAGRL